jgi:hypothetical protein
VRFSHAALLPLFFFIMETQCSGTDVEVRTTVCGFRLSSMLLALFIGFFAQLWWLSRALLPHWHKSVSYDVLPIFECPKSAVSLAGVNHTLLQISVHHEQS